MRIIVATATLGLAFVGLSAAAEGQAAMNRMHTNIPPEALGPALRSLAKELNFQIVYASKDVVSRQTQGALGEFTPDEALEKVLRGTGMTFRYVDPHTVTVLPVAGATPAPAGINLSGKRSSAPPQGDGKEGKKSSSSGFRMSQMARAPAEGGSTLDPGTAQFDGLRATLHEVVVTAEKRTENIQNVPMSMTALTGAQLANSASFQFQDYAGMVPGLTLIDDGALGSQLVLRGITSGGTAVNSPVAVYIDETPYTAAGPWAGSFLIAPNLDTFDMKRIEVLRGPQGTLYGAQALGGLLKYVTNPPDPHGFAAAAELGGDSVKNGGTGFDTHAMVNLPLSQEIALRIVGYDRYNPGYVDDPSRGLTDINGSHFIGGRASLLFQPNEAFSARLSAINQNRTWGDNGNEDVQSGTLTPVYGPLIQERPVGQPGYGKNALYNLTLDYDLGFATLLSSTSESTFQDRAIVDFTNEFANSVSTILHGSYGMIDLVHTHDRFFTQELRLTSDGRQRLDWQLGAFLTNQNGTHIENFYPVALLTKTILYDLPTTLHLSSIPIHYREYAVYGDLNFHITRTLDFGLGGRLSRNEQSFSRVASGVFAVGQTNFATTSSESDFTYSGNLRWRVTPAQMVYSRIATGYQPGGPQDVPITSVTTHSYKSSTATSYEVGMKDTLARRLIVDISAFHINWRQIQVQAVIGGFNLFTNGGNARSDGVEWDFTYLPTDRLTIDLNGSYTHAYLTEPTPAAVNGRIGDRLPGSPLFGGSANAEYSWPITASYSAFAGFTGRYTGDRYSDFTASGSRQQMPSFDVFDLRAGMKTGRATVTVYVKNIGNKIALDYVRPYTLAAQGPLSAVVYPPRTVGLSLSVAY